MSTIPADLYAEVTPSVLSANGNAVNVIGLVLTTNARVPIGSVLSFPDTAAVASYFGPTSHQAAFAAVYFAGYTGATAQPGALLYAQYPLVAVGAFLRGGNISNVPLATLQGYNGTLNVMIDGILKTASINLSAATGFSNAAEIIANALGIEGPQVASVTGTIASTVLTVAAVGSGALAVGDVISGAGVTSGTYITSFGTGTGGTGTYNLSSASTVGSPETILGFAPAVTYDSVSGAFNIISATTGSTSTITFGSGALATELLLTQATGAVDSQGAVAATPSGFMTTLVGITTDWVTFTTDFDPDSGSGNAQKQLFAAWNTLQDDAYVYVCWDTDITPTQSVPAMSSLGYILQNNGNSGTCLIYESSDLMLAAFVMGAAASINFNATNGRITFAYKAQAGIQASVTTGTAAVNLGGNPQVIGSFGNGYNYYGAVGAANEGFLWFQRGTITGAFAWLDSFINQVWLNSFFQATILAFFGAVGAVPFTPGGAAAIEQALSTVIAAGLNFGAYGPSPGALSGTQIAAINNAAGISIAGVLQTQGYYLQINPAPANVRASRGPWEITFWYLDNGAVQSISLSSIAVD